MEDWTERLDTAVTEHRWQDVAEVLSFRDDVISVDSRNRAVEGCIQSILTAIDRFSNIVVKNRDKLNIVLNGEFPRGWWGTVAEVLDKGVGTEQQKKVAVDIFIETAAEDGYRYIIPHCDREQLYRVLNIALKNGWWSTVIEVLEKGVPDEKQKKVAVETLIQTTTDKYYFTRITPHCDREQLDKVLNRALTEGWWSTVIKVLDTGVYDKLQKKVAIDTFIDNATENYYDIMPHCDREQLNRVLNRSLTEGWWSTVINVLTKGVLYEQQKILAVDTLIENATEKYCLLIIPHCDKEQKDRVVNRAVTEEWFDHVLGTIVCEEQQKKLAVDTFIKHVSDDYYYTVLHYEREGMDGEWNRAVTKLWCGNVIKFLDKGVYDVQQKKVAVDTFIENASKDYYKIITHCDTDQLDRVLNRALTEGWWDTVTQCIEKGVVITALHTWKVLAYHIIQQRKLPDSSETMRFLNLQNTRTLMITSDEWSQLSEDQKTVALMVSLEELRITDSLSPLLVNQSDLSQEEHSVCVMILMKEDRWDQISQVCLCHLWEQVGRELLQEAVDKKRWSIVQQWADHTVYDDQRWWAVKEAYKEKQWRVMLLLSDHGLTEIELMWVYYRLAMFADWATVGHMLQRGVDVTDLREVVENAMISTKTARDPAKRLALGKRWIRLKALEEKMSNVSSRQAYTAAKSCKWSVVMPSLHYQHGKIRHQLIQITLKVALEHRAWHVVMQLIKLDMKPAQRDSLFTDMVRQQQWGVCRALLDHGVSVHLCLDVLPQLMQKDQWLLVARIMEYDLDDATRRAVMQCAMERRQGSVVWRCISSLQNYRLSDEEREQLFHQAISRCVLQAVKPLIEKKDQTGLRHRDGALLGGIELRQWDVVDYCQEQNADINIKNDRGETPLNRAARKKDWKTVKALVVRGGDTNILDSDGRSLLYRTIEDNEIDLTKLVIEFHGDIHKEIEHVTPLQSLIGGCFGDVIHRTLMWCPDQAKGVNEEGETTLHAIALDKRPEFLYHQVVRGVNPLSVTKEGQSVLLYAVKNTHCAGRMVAECIRLGFSTHQPALTVTPHTLEACLVYFWNARMGTTSPLLLALMLERFTVAHMLYESGSCSYSQLFHMYTELFELCHTSTWKGQRLLDAWREQWQVMDQRICFKEYLHQCKLLMDSVTAFLPYLREMATTPRSLVSTCRLVISHCLNVRRRYENDVYQLPLTDRMKKFILFSDLTDPDYDPYLHATLPPRKPQKRKYEL